jgi:hypothetical protein
MKGAFYQRWTPGRDRIYLSGLGAEDGSFAEELATLPEIDLSTDPLFQDTGGLAPGAFGPYEAGQEPQSSIDAWDGNVGVTTATPEEQSEAMAWLLKEFPAGAPSTSIAAPSATVLSKLALTAAQLTAGVQAGTVVAAPGGSCPTGYRYATGVCVPGIVGAGGATKPAGQWFSFATNKQVVTFGAVVIGALVLVNLIPSGGGRRRR